MCISCNGALDGSLEHVFPQALGGTKKSRDLYCSACNVRLGAEIDAPFTKDFEFATTALNVKRDRGAPPVLKATTTKGTRIYLGPGGVPSMHAPTSTIIEAPDGTRQVVIKVPADRPEQHEHMLAKTAKELGIDAAALPLASISFKIASAGTVNGEMAAGGPQQARAVAKIALGFLALEIGDEVFTEPYATLRLAVTHGGDARAWLNRPFRQLVAPILPLTDGVQHRVIIYTTMNQTWAYVEVYGVYGYGVLLAETVDARFASPYVWAQNPTTGASGEGRASGTPLPTPVCKAATPTQEDHRELLTTMYRVAFEIAYESTIDEEVAIAFAQLGEGDPRDPAFLGELHRRITERLDALQDRRVVNLSRPVASKDVLDRIRQALRALPQRNKRRDAEDGD